MKSLVFIGENSKTKQKSALCLFLGRHIYAQPLDSLVVGGWAFILLFFFCVFIILLVFFASFFPSHLFFFCIFFCSHLFSTYRTEPDRPRPDSCASNSESLISLSYSMPAFSANSFRLFLVIAGEIILGGQNQQFSIPDILNLKSTSVYNICWAKNGGRDFLNPFITDNLAICTTTRASVLHCNAIAYCTVGWCIRKSLVNHSCLFFPNNPKYKIIKQNVMLFGI